MILIVMEIKLKHCLQKKRDRNVRPIQCFLLYICYKTPTMLTKFDIRAVSWKRCCRMIKRFPPHPNNVYTCETWNAHYARATVEYVVKERNSRLYPTSIVASKFVRFESSWQQHAVLSSNEVDLLRYST